jgi:hypothetical protein
MPVAIGHHRQLETGLSCAQLHVHDVRSTSHVLPCISTDTLSCTRAVRVCLLLWAGPHLRDVALISHDTLA